MSFDSIEETLSNILETRNFSRFKGFIKCLDNLNEDIIKSENNSLKLLHICVGLEDTEFGLKCLKYLLSLDEVDVNSLAKIDGTSGITGAYYAVLWNRYNALQTLIDSGTDVCICDSYGRTPLDKAILLEDREEAVELIQKHLNSLNHTLIDQKIQIYLNDMNSSLKSLNQRNDQKECNKRTELEQTVIYFDENDSIWSETQNRCQSSDSDNSSVNTLKSNISYEKTDSIQSCSSDKTEVYVYNDRDYNVVLIEERYDCPLNKSDVVLSGSATDDNSNENLDQIIQHMSETQIFNELQAMGDSPGPVIQSTKKLYAKRLMNIRRNKFCSPSKKCLPLPNHSEELNRLIQNTFPFDEAIKLEQQLIDFYKNDCSKQNYFNYILLDPNISQNFPFDTNSAKIVNSCSQIDINLFIRFVKSIFYIGKGQGDRVYQHFYEAIKIKDTNKYSPKVERIVNVWSTNKGVISLHCFHDISSDEALTREAMIIEALMLSNLTNQVKGQNKSKLKWNDRKKRIFGSYLVYKSFLIYLLTGERQIRRPTIQ